MSVDYSRGRMDRQAYGLDVFGQIGVVGLGRNGCFVFSA